MANIGISQRWSVMRLTGEHLEFLRSIRPDEPRVIRQEEAVIATQELANALVKTLRYLGKHGLAEVAIFFDQGWYSSIDELVGRHGADGLDAEHWVFNNGICVQLTLNGERVVQGDERDAESTGTPSLSALLDRISRAAPDVPELSSVETGLLEAHLAHVPRRQVSWGRIQREKKAGVETYRKELAAGDERKAHLKSTLAFNQDRHRKLQVRAMVRGGTDPVAESETPTHDRHLEQIVRLARSLPVTYPEDARRLLNAREVLRGVRDDLRNSDRVPKEENPADPLGWILLVPEHRAARDAVNVAARACDEAWQEVCLLRELVATYLDCFTKLRFLPNCVLRPAWHDIDDLDWIAVIRELRSIEVEARRALRLEQPPAASSPKSREPARHDGDEDALAELDRMTPPLSRNNGLWVISTEAADIESLLPDTLSDYRSSGIATRDKRLGRDRDGRVWRRDGTDHSRPWYLRSTLKNSQEK